MKIVIADDSSLWRDRIKSIMIDIKKGVLRQELIIF